MPDTRDDRVVAYLAHVTGCDTAAQTAARIPERAQILNQAGVAAIPAATSDRQPPPPPPSLGTTVGYAYLVIYPSGGLAGVYLDEALALRKAKPVEGAVARLPLAADYRPEQTANGERHGND